jgi:transposase InsO family protein
MRYSSYEGETTPAPPNIVKRNFHADKPSTLWLTDSTEFEPSNGKVYLSAIVDCFDGKIVGWKTGKHPTMEIAETSLHQALETHPPMPNDKLVVHSDRGTHYRANSWITITRNAGIIRSMSKKGCSPDNSVCEGFFGRMKNEMYYYKIWHDVDELEAAINSCIEFYNHKRIKYSLGGISVQAHRELLAS